MNSPYLSLDRIDIRILDLLQSESKISNIKLAEMVNLSPTAVLARVQKLTKEGFILGYEARLNPIMLNNGFVVLLKFCWIKPHRMCWKSFLRPCSIFPISWNVI